MGELLKKRFEPSQAFAMVLKKQEYASVIDLPAKDERVIRYLKGETIEIEDGESTRDSGWQLVCVDGYPLGWGKLIRGTLRNKYFSGWRMNA
jgi:NOL1/NOP2/fmu family ribosome biogenesis protein